MFHEASIIPLANGRLLGTGRLKGDYLPDQPRPAPGEPTPYETSDHMVITESDDGGVNWTTPRQLTNYSEPHGHLLRLNDGRILCTYASYHLPFGIFAMFSNDDGQTWDSDHPILLAMSLDYYTGWPSSVQLPDGSIVTIYAIKAYIESETSLGRDAAAEVIRWNAP